MFVYRPLGGGIDYYPVSLKKNGATNPPTVYLLMVKTCFGSSLNVSVTMGCRFLINFEFVWRLGFLLCRGGFGRRLGSSRVWLLPRKALLTVSQSMHFPRATKMKDFSFLYGIGFFCFFFVFRT